MIYEVTLDGIPLSISIAPLSFPRNDQTRIRQLSDEVQRHLLKFSIISNDVIHLEESPSLFLGNQLLELISNDSDVSNALGKHLFVVPFDSLIYVATINIEKGYQEIIEEDLVSLNKAIEMMKQISQPVVFQCGIKSNDLKNLGYDLQEGLNLHSQNNAHVFKRAKDISFVVTRLAGLITPVVLLLFVLFYGTSLLSEEVIQQVTHAPTVASNLAPAITHISDQIDGYAPLLSYGVNALGLETTYNGSAINITALYPSISNSDYSRIKELTDGLGGNLHITQGGFFINNIASPVSFVGNPQVDIDTIETILHKVFSLQARGYEINIGDKTSSSVSNYTEYTPVITLKNPSSTALLRLGRLLGDTGIDAQYLSHTYTIENGLFSQITLRFLIRGT